MKKAYRIKSLAGTKEVYTVIQCRTAGNSIKGQAVGPEMNREYGLSFTIDKKDAPELYDWLVKAEAPVVVTKTITTTVDPIVNSSKDLYAKA